VVDEAIRQIASSGLLGAIVIVLGVAYWKQSQALAAVQEARVADAQKVAQTLLSIQDRWQQAVADLTKAVEKMNERGGS